jgi:thiamine-phosphate pyrophosphorylase
MVVTSRLQTGGRSLAAVIAAVCQARPWAVQLREKDLPARELWALVQQLRPITRAAGVRLIVNDRLDVALAGGADGVHLGQGSLPAAAAREMLDRAGGAPDFLIGVSVHSPAEAAAALAGRPDYLLFGHVFPTASHPGEPPRGLAALAAVAALAAPCPVLAIGGVGPDNAAGVLRAGAVGVAVMGLAMQAPDPRGALLALARALEEANRP